MGKGFTSADEHAKGTGQRHPHPGRASFDETITNQEEFVQIVKLTVKDDIEAYLSTFE